MYTSFPFDTSPDLTITFKTSEINNNFQECVFSFLSTGLTKNQTESES